MLLGLEPQLKARLEARHRQNEFAHTYARAWLLPFPVVMHGWPPPVLFYLDEAGSWVELPLPRELSFLTNPHTLSGVRMDRSKAEAIAKVICTRGLPHPWSGRYQPAGVRRRRRGAAGKGGEAMKR